MAKDPEIPTVNAHVPVLVGLFGLSLPLPFVLAVREMRWPRDKMSLPLDDEYVRNPRQFALALREHLGPYLSERQEGVEVLLRRRERVAFHEALEVPPNGTVKGILMLSGALATGPGASLQEAWVQGNATLAERATVRGLACDGDLSLGARSTVGRWIDSEHDTRVGEDCDLGMSATSAGTLSISPRCSFRRLWGRPIRTLGTPPREETGATSRRIEDEVVWADDRLSIPPGARLSSGVVVHGALHIGEGADIGGTVKADGEIVIGSSVRIRGNVIGRRSMQIGNATRIDGNVFAERDISVGPSVEIGREEGFKTVYAAGSVLLGAGSSIYGWIVAERGGTVTGT
jgi:predicted acyltransferase (DUF342 family)